MRRTRASVTILAASLVVLVTIAALLIATVATYLTVRNGQQNRINPDFLPSLYRSAGAALLIGLLLSAALCALLWRTLLRPLNRIDRYANSVGTSPHAEPHSAAPTPQYASPEVTSFQHSIEHMARQLRAHDAALQKSESMLSTILDAVPYSVWWKDPHGVYLGCNQAFVEGSGCRQASEIVGRTDYDIPGLRQDADAYRANDREVLMAHRAMRHIIEPVTRGDRVCRWADVTKLPLTDAGGAVYAILGVSDDVTERKAVEDYLRHEKALIDAIFDSIPGVVHLYDGQDRLVRWNARATEQTGFSDEELMNRPVAAGRSGEDLARVLDAFHRAKRDGRATVETFLITKDGRGVPALFKGVRVTLDDRLHVLVIGIDITEHKRAEEYLRRAMEQAESANRAKDHFLAAVSHELRTPLAPILFLSSSLEADPRLPDDAHNDLTDIREHAEIEKRLIGDLLDFSAIHAGKLQIHPVHTDVHDVLLAAIRTCKSGIDRKRIRLDVHLGAQRHHAHGDPDRLRQTFWNLLQNACKFTPDECAISVRTCDDDDGLTLRIEVIDTGMGMTPETLQRIFRPFEQGPRDDRTRHVGGLGLGLAISRSIVDAHGGSITATSDGPGRGSAFVVRLPVTAKAPPAPHPITPSFSPAEHPPLRLLLVEDHPLTLKLLGRILSAEGHEVTTAASIDAALRAAAERPFDLVLSDLTLPDGSGLDLMPLLRDRHHLPGIALSGYGSDEDIDRSRRAGFLAHLVKPVTPESLRTALAQFAASQLTPSTTDT